MFEELRLLLESLVTAPTYEWLFTWMYSQMVDEIALLREPLHASAAVEEWVKSLCDVVDFLGFIVTPPIDSVFLGCWLGYWDFLKHIADLPLQLRRMFLAQSLDRRSNHRARDLKMFNLIINFWLELLILLYVWIQLRGYTFGRCIASAPGQLWG